MMTKTNSAEDGLRALAKFADKWPGLADNVYMIQSKLGLFVRAKQYSEAKELAEKLIAKVDRSRRHGRPAERIDDIPR